MSGFQDNQRKAATFLERFACDGVKNQIAGEAVEAASGESFETISPVDLKPLAKVARGNADDIDRAAKAAKAAFPAWAAMTGDKRKALLHKVADAIVAKSRWSNAWIPVRPTVSCRRPRCAALRIFASLLTWRRRRGMGGRYRRRIS